MYAAIAASEQGKSVSIISKGKVGLSGSSLVSMSVHRYPAAESSLRKEYQDKFFESGAGQQIMDVAELFVNKAASAVESLEKYNLPLEYRKQIAPNGKEYTCFACCSPKRGIKLTMPLSSYIKSHTSVVYFEGYMAVEIAVVDGQACGVVAELSGKLHFFPCKTIVLATGGGGNIYKNTTNSKDITGDGYAMALLCGLKLIDMEFVQFYPYRIRSPIVADIFPDLFSHGAVYRNGKGERFMDNYPKKELENRDVLSRAVYMQDRVLLDLTECDKKFLEKECPKIASAYQLYKKEPFVVVPMAHFFMGGIPLRPNCATSIKNLYACGEVTGGLHGANRLSGSALTEAAVFGRIAGCSAAAHAEDQLEPTNTYKLSTAIPEIGNDDIFLLRAELRQLAWENLSIIRTSKGLVDLSVRLRQIEEDFLKLKPLKLREWFEMRNMIIVCRYLTKAALERPSSLGAHYMEDNANRREITFQTQERCWSS